MALRYILPAGSQRLFSYVKEQVKPFSHYLGTSPHSSSNCYYRMKPTSGSYSKVSPPTLPSFSVTQLRDPTVNLKMPEAAALTETRKNTPLTQLLAAAPGPSPPTTSWGQSSTPLACSL